MKNMCLPFINWRCDVLALLSMFAVILISGATEDVFTLLWTKVTGFFLAWLTYRLAKYWKAKGKINELSDMADDE